MIFHFNPLAYWLHLVLVVIALCGCIKSAEESQQAKAPRRIRWAVPDTLFPLAGDWRKCSEQKCHRHASLVMEGLFSASPTTSGWKATPLLARQVDTLASGVFRISLRSAQWSDGKPLEARDFTDSWKQVLSRCKTFPDASRLFAIAGAEDFCKGRVAFSKVGVAIEAGQLLVQTAFGQQALFRALAHPVSWPRRTAQKKSPSPPTLGPFLAPAGGSRQYLANARYHSRIKIDGVEFITLASSQERIGLYRERSVDVVEGIEPGLFQRLESDPDLILQPTPERVFLVLDTQHPAVPTALRAALLSSLPVPEIRPITGAPLLPISSAVSGLKPPPPIAVDTSQKFADSTIGMGTPPAQPILDEIARALKAKWEKQWELAVEMRPGTPPVQILLWKEDWYGMLLPSFLSTPTPPHSEWQKLQDAWVRDQLGGLPLYTLARSVLSQSRVRGWSTDPSGEWRFGQLEVE